MRAWKLTATQQPFLLSVKLQVLRNFPVFRTDVSAWGTRVSSQTVVDKILLNKMLSHLARAGVSVLGVVYTSWQSGITESCPKCWSNVTPFTSFCHHAVLFCCSWCRERTRSWVCWTYPLATQSTGSNVVAAETQKSGSNTQIPKEQLPKSLV